MRETHLVHYYLLSFTTKHHNRVRSFLNHHLASLIMIAMMIWKPSERRGRIATGWQMHTENPAARQTIQIGRHPSAVSARTLMGFEDTDATAEGTPGMETVLEPEWVGTRGGERGLCGLWWAHDGAGGISYHHVCFPILFHPKPATLWAWTQAS